MKKALIAGAASAALAAMPVVGVFAVGNSESITDTLKLTINDTCAMTIADTGRTADTSVIAGGSWGTADTDGNATYTGTVTNNTSYVEFATTNFKVLCNNAGGYQVTLTPSAFTNANVTGDDYAWPYVAGTSGTAATLSTSASQWTLSSTGEGADLASATIAKRMTSLTNAGTTFVVKYSAFVDAGQPAGEYTATAAYTFAKL